LPSLDTTKRETIRVRNIKLVDEAVFAQADKEGVQQFYISQGEMTHRKLIHCDEDEDHDEETVIARTLD